MGSITALCLSMKLLVLAIAAISTVSASKAVTCDECQAAVTDLVARLLSEETVTEAVAYLQGDCFCGQDGHTEECPTLVETVLPMAMPVLGAALMEQSTELCQEVVGVC